MTATADRSRAAALADKLSPALQPGSQVVVTGCAGFIGSHLTEILLELGCRVVGVDSFTDYYDPVQKQNNLATCRDHPAFTFHARDLLDLDPVELLADSTVCFHLAAQAGVRASWGSNFSTYLANNVQATQRLLEACLSPRVRKNLVRFVYSSSSSVYGDQDALPVTETALPSPRSPYGVTKLAAEHLCVLYSANHGVPTSSLRYFTVYGPRQRPDMAFRRFIDRTLAGEPFHVFGDGSQTRDFTYVFDAVRANLLAVAAPARCELFNVGGGARISLRDALDQLTSLLAEADPALIPELRFQETARGDVRDTFADRSRIESTVGYRPSVKFGEGLCSMVRWALAGRTKGD
jgi:UDP-glucose 4-epimerase